MDESLASWLSGHLHHHQSLDQVVLDFVQPLVASLLKDGQIDAFFFVRASLGGPHLRLRLHVVPGAEGRVIEAMQSSAQSFLAQQPSTRSLSPEAIQRSNSYILAADPHESDDSVYPDNWFRMAPFQPEVERYGGVERFRSSLDFFTLSSVAAVDFLLQHRSDSRSALLGSAFRLLLQQALGFADSESEFSDLLRYGVDSWGSLLPKVVEKGTRVAESQTATFLHLFQQSLSAVRSANRLRTASGFLVQGASRLSATLAAADRITRTRVGGSQLHMTASRMGLSNAEEVYLSRLLGLTLLEVQARGDEDLSWVGQQVDAPGEDPSKLLPPALALLNPASDS
jgi:Lantibiotic biosynthesis dehydratase C-term